MLLKIVVYALLLWILTFIFERCMRKWLGIEKVKGRKRYVNKLQFWGETLITISFVIVTVLLEPPPFDLVRIIVLYCIVLFSFITFIEWKFLRNSKEYMITMPTGILMTLLIIISIPYIMDFLG